MKRKLRCLECAILACALFVAFGSLGAPRALAHLVGTGDCPGELSAAACRTWVENHNGFPIGSDPYASADSSGGGSKPVSGPVCSDRITHPASPVRIFQCNDDFIFYWVGAGEVFSGPYIPPVAELAQTYTGVTLLYRGVNPLTGKPVTITYFPQGENKAEAFLRVRTFYADVIPYAVNKPYSFDIHPDPGIVYLEW